MRRIGTLVKEAGLFDLAGSSDPASLRPAACEPVLFGDLVAVIVSDLGALRLNYCMPAIRSVSERRAR